MALNNIKPPSAADVAAMWQASGLKNKIIFTFLMVVAFRFGAQIPIYGINNTIFQNIAAGNNIIGFLDLFSGGALGKVSMFALGIGPYITAQIIIQLLAVVIPSLEKLQKEEGEAGRRLLPGVSPAMFYISSITALTAGSVLVMWISELITEHGIGNGGSLIIFVGIISGIPLYSQRTSELITQDPSLQFGLLALLTIFFATMVLIVIMQEAMRKVIIVNPKRQVGNKVYGGVNTYIPFKLNPGGVMPIIFAIAILLFPSTILSVLGQANLPGSIGTFVLALNKIFSPSGATYYIIYFLMIVFLTFFYASIMPNMQPKEIANNLKKYGSSIPGIKPGKPTADALDKILSRVTFIGALALGMIALVPSFTSYLTKITTVQGIGATSLIIMVGVALDLINQVRTHLLAKNYESFLKDK